MKINLLEDEITEQNVKAVVAMLNQAAVEIEATAMGIRCDPSEDEEDLARLAKLYEQLFIHAQAICAAFPLTREERVGIVDNIELLDAIENAVDAFIAGEPLVVELPAAATYAIEEGAPWESIC